jgi:hypothetical protein
LNLHINLRNHDCTTQTLPTEQSAIQKRAIERLRTVTLININIPHSPAIMAPLTTTLHTFLVRTTSLLPRTTPDSNAGVIPPNKMPNKVVFIVFALIGAGFVLTGIWFFFWAKNGGFYFKENDWDDYKSTVLRRKGPNGTTLSGATESTDLGGGSIVHGEKNGRSRWGREKKKKGGKNTKGREGSLYKDFEDETSTLNGTDLGSELSDLKWKEQQRHKAKKEKKKTSRFSRGDARDRDIDNEEMDVGVANTIRAYRHEKPARVGGLNKVPDGSAFDGSTQDGSSAASDLLSHREKTPTNTPTKVKKDRNDNYTGGSGGIRKVVSTSQPSTTASSTFWSRGKGEERKIEAEEERIKAEAKKLQDKGRAAKRRDFSFQVGDDISSNGSGIDEERRARREARRASRSPEKKVPGSYYAESDIGSAVSRETGTKSYHHPIPGLSSSGGTDYAEERRKKRNGGYRREEM